MRMDTPEEVIRKYCALSGQVAEGVFNYEHSADCFCSPHTCGWSYCYEEYVFNYIKAAVHEKMLREQHDIPFSLELS